MNDITSTEADSSRDKDIDIEYLEVPNLESFNATVQGIMKKLFLDEEFFTICDGNDRLSHKLREVNHKILDSNFYYFAYTDEGNDVNSVFCILRMSTQLLCLFVDSKKKEIREAVLSELSFTNRQEKIESKIFCYEYQKKNEINLFLLHALKEMMSNLNTDSREEFIKKFDDPLKSPIIRMNYDSIETAKMKLLESSNKNVCKFMRNVTKCMSNNNNNDIKSTAEKFIYENTTHPVTSSKTGYVLSLMKTIKKHGATFSKSGTSSAKDIKISLKKQMCYSPVFESIREQVDTLSNIEESKVVKVEIILPASLFEESNLICDDYEVSTEFRNSSVGWVKFVINNQHKNPLISLTCYPISERSPQKSKMIFYHKESTNASLPMNSNIFVNNTEVSVENEVWKYWNILKTFKKIGIVVGCGECGYDLKIKKKK